MGVHANLSQNISRIHFRQIQCLVLLAALLLWAMRSTSKKMLLLQLYMALNKGMELQQTTRALAEAEKRMQRYTGCLDREEAPCHR
jgi:hypothetical protein